MLHEQKSRAEITYRLLLSFTGLLIVVFLVAFPPTVTSDFLWRKSIIGTTFGIVCVLGVLAVIFPTKCSGLLEPQKQNSDPSSIHYNSQESSINLKGHHPTCGKYSAHVFQLLGKTRCAACIGLMFGALLALVGSVLYFFVGLTFSDYSLVLVVFGAVGIMVGLFQFVFRGLFRLVANTVFVVSTFLVLVSIDIAVGNLFFDLFVVCLVVFWLFTRISLSKWDHERICSSCETENCSVRT
jgi:cytochrome c biogenesis factor